MLPTLVITSSTSFIVSQNIIISNLEPQTSSNLEHSNSQLSTLNAQRSTLNTDLSAKLHVPLLYRNKKNRSWHSSINRMKRRRNSTLENARISSNKTSQTQPLLSYVALCLLLLLTLSTARSFQPTSSSQYKNIQCSNPQRHRKERDSLHHNQSGPLYTSATSPSASFSRMMINWAAKFVPSDSFKREKQRGNAYYSGTVACDEAVEYRKRKDEWANRYTKLDSLRETFGSNRNKVWGDLDAATARRLYKTLLPRALLELVKVGVQPEDLAPLAYQARVSAKLYARERCQVPARLAATLYDGFRQWKRYGKFQGSGMSYDQVWEKYQKAIMDDCSHRNFDDLTEQDVTAKICLKILERSCTTNERIDRWVLSPEDEEQREDLARITQTLETDVRKLLDPIACKEVSQNYLTLQQYRTLRLVARARRRARRRNLNAMKRASQKDNEPHIETRRIHTKPNTRDRQKSLLTREKLHRKDND
jgi:hypothetical protein